MPEGVAINDPMPASTRPKIRGPPVLSAKWNVVVADWTLYDQMLDADEWLFASRKAADAFEPGARAIVYLLSRAGPFSGVAAIVEATAAPRPVPKGLQVGHYALYPHRVPIRVVARIRPVPVAPLLPHLTFVPKGASWGLAFRGHAIRRIPKVDFDLLAKAVRAAHKVTRLASAG